MGHKSQAIESVAPAPVAAPAPAPVAPPEDPMFLVRKLLALHGYTLAGMYRAALAFLKNYNSVQGNSMALMKASQTIEDEQLQEGQNFMASITGDQQEIQQITKEYNDWVNSNPNASDTDRQNWQNWLTSSLAQVQGQSSVDNTGYSSMNQFFSGLNNGVNQTSSDETQTESLDMQMFQQGIVDAGAIVGKLHCK
jgi:hypothetical protein